MKRKAALALVLLLGFASLGYSQGTTTAMDLDTSAVIQPQVIPVVDINYRVEETRKLLTDLADDLEYTMDIKKIDSLIDDRDRFLQKEAREFHEYNPHNLSKFFLENTYRAWEGYRQQLNGWKSVINSRLARSKTNVVKLVFVKTEWDLTLEANAKAGEVPEIQQRIREVITEIDAVIEKFKRQTEYLINLEALITDAMSFSDNIIQDVDKLQQNLRDSLFIAREPPIWRISLRLENMDYFKGRINKLVNENTKILRNYFSSLNITLFLIVFLVTAILVYQLRRRYFKLNLDEEDPAYVNVRRILGKKIFASLASIAFFLFIFLFPYNPLAITALLLLLLLFCMQSILSEFIGSSGKRVIWMMVILMIINQLEIVMWYFGDWARLFITLEALIMIFAALYLIQPAKRKIFLRESPFMRKAVRLGYIVFVFAVVAFFSNIFGYLDLAVLILKIAVSSVIVILIIYGVAKLFKVILVCLFTILRSLRDDNLLKYLDKLQARSMNVVNILAIIYLLSSILTIMEIRRPVIDYLVRNLEEKWVVGTMTISIGGVLLLVLILLITLAISSFFKVLIEEEIAPRVKLPKGVPFAISVTIRYFIIVLGFVMALSAAGIDLGEFGLIAGALGIGIGFGLQNIVGNFISGLILIYERPVQSGDTVEVENLMGIVKRIGIRSSSVRTYDGAEVVVPNSNLVSNQLINWTLSDNRKRLEIKVGVAYGSDPNQVMELLKKVAVNHEKVLKDPEPLPLFEGFGDSSLNFRILFWVHFEDGFVTRSDVSIGIYNILMENNITIPFPQLDLHVQKDEENESVGKKSKD